MIGRTISHYKILEKLGQGGMGVVYKAEDTKLKRPVALKFLPPEALTRKTAKTRLWREARAAAALDHPNICTVYEIEEADGYTFIAMACLEGCCLKEKIAGGALGLAEVMDVAIQTAEGLAHAHRNGVIHRDVKPANIAVTPDGVVKILDFGLARMAKHTQITTDGTAVGTIAYISPEQVRGEKVDHRTDIWSYGVMLYEIITGRLPFHAEYEQAVVYAILNTEPKSVRVLREDVPVELGHVVHKAMAKNREDRFYRLDDVLSILKPVNKTHASRFGTDRAGAGESTPSIAVVPFANLSADPELDYFCDGLAEEIINTLGRLGNLRVVARTSAFSFKNKSIDIRDIGAALNVATLLEGSVRKSGKRLRISVQLVNVADGYQLWAGRFDREMRDIFAVQDEISLAIADSLRIRIMGDEKDRMLEHGTEDPEAHILYLKGRYFWNKRTEEDIRKSVDYFQRAVEKDPDYALAYTGMADAYVTLATYRFSSVNEAAARAKEAVAKALGLDPELGEAHASLASIKLWVDWDWEGAGREFRRSLDLNPFNAEAHHQYAHLLSQTGRFDEAIEQMTLALELEPLSLNINTCLGQVLFLARRYEEATDQLKKTIEMNPAFYDGHSWLGMTYLMQGMFEQAVATFKDAAAFEVVEARMKAALAHTYALMGEKRKSLEILKQLQTMSDDKRVDSYLFAVVYAGFADIERTMEYLLKAYKERSLRLFSLVKVDPLLDCVRSDRRYKDLLEQTGLGE